MQIRQHHPAKKTRYPWVITLLAVLLLSVDNPPLLASTSAPRSTFEKSIIDYCGYLNPNFNKTIRKKTGYIIVHTSEGGLAGTLKTVSQGKCISGRPTTYGGHAHYVIGRDGRVYCTLDPKYRADHAGLSMWNGVTDISSISIGIELASYHYADITAKQYGSLAQLIDTLQRRYGLNDRAVLTHSQVAYGKPNCWHATNHRGRKRCAKNLDRKKAGLGPGWDYDPDVRAGRLAADPELAAIFYEHRPQVARAAQTNIITKASTAWMIAGEDYDSPSTWYKLPDNRIIPGDSFEREIGWGNIPQNTVVLLNQEQFLSEEIAAGPIKTITDGLSAWSLAGRDYNKKTTIYFFPDGHMKNGRQVPDWDEIPPKTKVIIGYNGPYLMKDNKNPKKFVGDKYNNVNTVYYLAGKELLTGDQIKDFSKLPNGTSIFLTI